MKIKLLASKGFAILLALSMLTSFSQTTVYGEENTGQTESESLLRSGQSLQGATLTMPDGVYLISKTDSNICPGVKQTKIVTNSAEGTDQVIGHAVTVNLANTQTAGIMAGYKNYNGSSWGMQTVREQAYAAESKTGNNVVCAINADFFNMTTGEPLGLLVMNGVVCHTGGSPYFAILKDGSAVIRNGNIGFQDVKEAVAGSSILVENGIVTTQFSGSYETSDEPRTAVGIKADGSVVFYVADGRQYPKSSGLSLQELAKMMKAIGCVSALNLDGGGSTTLASELEGSNQLLVQNSPSDGVERTVSSSLFIISTAKPTGVFDHAVLTPNNNIYTPYSSVEFKATGVDSSGALANLPSNISWSLSDDSKIYGEINNTGIFSSNGVCGTVTVNLLLDGNIVGTTSIQVVEPDIISFSNDEISLGFSSKSDLGLRVYSNGREVIYNSQDIIWSMSDPSMGSFENGIFTSSDYATVTGTIKASYRFNEDVNDSIIAIIGKLPTIAWNFENPDFYTIGSSADAGTNFYTATAGYGETGSAELVDLDSGQPVRFGNYSLKLNFNFTTSSLTRTEGVYFGATMSDVIPGNPTGIGMWVYVPEGTANFWLRAYVKDGSGKLQAIDFTKQTSQCAPGETPGLNWTGWKYVEADLTKLTGPIILEKGYTIRLMWVPGIGMGSKSAGCVYFDNLQFVYGANIDDKDQPVIDTIQGNDIDITDGLVFDTNNITFTSTFHDVENRYMTGIDYDLVRMYIDGVNVVNESNYYLDKGGNKNYFYNATLPNGKHSIKVLLRDGFGNETILIKYFNVNGVNQYTNLDFSLDTSSKLVLGGEAKVLLTTKNMDDISDIILKSKFNKEFNVSSVTFSSGFDGQYTYEEGVLQLQVTRTSEEIDSSNVIATINFHIPGNLSKDTCFSYGVDSCTYSTIISTVAICSFSFDRVEAEISAPLVLESDTLIVGTTGRIYAKDSQGNNVYGASVYLESGTLLGVTDDNGLLETNVLGMQAGEYSVYAIKGNLISYYYTLISVNAAGDSNGLPYNIQSNGTKDGATAKNITWMVNPVVSDVQAIVEYATLDEYTLNGAEAFKQQVGTSTLIPFIGSSSPSGNYAVRTNAVNLTGLNEGETYIYRVGDGEKWSENNEFTTQMINNSTNFFIIGDIQSADMNNTIAILSEINQAADTYDFGLLTGDTIDDPQIYGYWNELQTTFNSIKNIDLIHVLGNHELMGDSEGYIASTLYNLPNKGYYSYEYDNVYVAVINYTNEKEKLQEAIGWLVRDASTSKATWKVLTMHQPAYYTNIAGGNEIINELIPPAVDAAGIDFVFSGHDHAYAKTEPLTARVIDTENGAVYFICGSTGEKSYAIVDNKDFHFTKLVSDYSAIYFSIEASLTEFNIIVKDINGNIIDTYQMIKSNPCKDGHQYLYYNNYLKCSICLDKIDLSNTLYTGFAIEHQSSRLMYFINSNYKVGWMNYLDDRYYFDSNGLGVDGEHEIDGVTYTFENGKLVNFTGFDVHNGKTKYYENGIEVKGWKEIGGYYYYFSTATYYMRTGVTTVAGVTYEFSSDGKLVKGSFVTKDLGVRYYWAGNYATGWREIDGNKYYFNLTSGYMLTGNQFIDGVFYQFSSKGVLISEGIENYTGFILNSGKTYYYNEGTLLTGWQLINGFYYYFSTGTATKGEMRTGTTTISSVTYEFAKSGELIKGTFVQNNLGTRYYYAGAYRTGWVTINEDRYYFNLKDGYMVQGIQVINSVTYFFGSDGKLISEGLDNYTGFLSTNSKVKYYENGSIITGWKEIEGYYYYFSTGTATLGEMRTGEQKVGGVTYIFSEDGKLIRGSWITSSQGTRYYYAGHYLLGWQTIDEITYFFHQSTGYMAVGSQVIDNVRYIFNFDGSLISSIDEYTGFLTVSGKTKYYSSGNIVTGWNSINGNMYYFSTGTYTLGEMRTGVTKIGGIEYNFSGDGVLLKGTFVSNTTGTRYYWAGSYVIGWLDIDNDRYYFSTEDGYMFYGIHEIDGIMYEFDASGRLINSNFSLSVEQQEAKTEEILVPIESNLYNNAGESIDMDTDPDNYVESIKENEDDNSDTVKTVVNENVDNDTLDACLNVL